MRKAKASGEDVQLALLSWRNTISEGFNSSPVQRLMSRRTKTPLTFVENTLIPEVPVNVNKDLHKQKEK